MQLEQLEAWRRHGRLAVAVVADEGAALAAVRRLQDAGIGNDRISLLALDTQRVHDAVEAIGPRAGQRIREDADCGVLSADVCPPGRDELEGAAIGGGVGLVLGLSLFAVPGVGPMLLAAGPVVMVVNVLAHGLGGGIGLGLLLGAIFDERVGEAQRAHFHARLEAGDWLVLVHGDAPAIARAAAAVRGEGVAAVETY